MDRVKRRNYTSVEPLNIDEAGAHWLIELPGEQSKNVRPRARVALLSLLSIRSRFTKCHRLSWILRLPRWHSHRA